MSRQAFDTVLLGGEVIDGTGSERRRTDVGWLDGRIAAMGALADAEATERVDVGGRVVCPGFVDIHGHSDLSILDHPAGTSKIVQGVTTEVAGNCGLAVAPVTSLDVVPDVRSRYATLDAPGVEWTWCTVAEYLQHVDEVRPALNIGLLAGHVALRTSVVGLDRRAATAGELETMRQLLDTALTDGALGLSLGLMYPPSSFADEAEYVALAEVVVDHDALLTVHMRDYSDGLLDSVGETIGVARAAGCRLQLSHLTVVGERNWGAVARALAMVDRAREQGVDVAFDMYPYLAGSTNLSQVVPDWAMDGGAEALRARLADPESRGRIAAGLADRVPGWDETMLSSVPWAPELAGRTVAELTTQSGGDPVDLVLDLLATGDPGMVAFGRSADDLRAALSHPASMIGSDGMALAVDAPGEAGLPHPRSFGTYPGLIERYVHGEPVLELEDAIRRCTSAPADRVGLADRGRLVPGARADVVVLDVATVAETSTYLEPRRPPEGIEYVYNHGVLVATEGSPTAARPGQAVRSTPKRRKERT